MNRSFCFIFLIPCLCFSSTHLYTQKNKSWIFNEIGAKMNAYNMYAVEGFDNRYEGVKGSPYLFDDWNNGTIVFNTGKSFSSSDILLNIDGYHNEALLLLYGEQIIGFGGEEVSTVVINSNETSDTFKIATTKELELKGEGYIYLQQLNHGPFKLFKQTKKVFLEADFKDPYSVDRRVDEFREEYFYFLRDESGEYEQIKPKLKYLKKLYPRRSKKMEKVIKNNNLYLKEEKDLILLIDQTFNQT